MNPFHGTMMSSEQRGSVTVSPPLQKPHRDDHHQDINSRTSCTYSDSWDATAAQNTGGVDVPSLLQPLFGLDFLPFPTSTSIPEDDVDVPPIEVPRSVQISADDTLDALSPTSDGSSSPKCVHRVLSPAPTPQDTAELQDLIIQSSKKKRKKRGKRFKAAAKAVLQRVKGSTKTSSVASSSSSKWRNSTKSSKRNDLGVDTDPPLLENRLDTSTWISPAATAATDATESPNNNKAKDKQEEEEQTRQQAMLLRQKAEEQEKLMKSTHSEVEGLQAQLTASITKYQEQLALLQATQERLAQLASSSQENSQSNSQSLVDQAEGGDNNERVLKRSESGHFMRAHDLSLNNSMRGSTDENGSISSLSQSGHAKTGTPTPEFLLMDHYLLEIIDQLNSVAYDLVTDETDRFSPTRDTAKLLSQMPSSVRSDQNGWSLQPWTPAWDNKVLVWTGHVNHDGFGHNWPVVKGRAILKTSAKNVLEYMWDSSLVPKYNPLCQGRLDLYTLQDDVHTSEEDSPYGFAGCAKIVRSLNKHRLLPKAIEMKVLMHAKPLEQHKGSYVLVSRSVWENDSATLDSQAAKSVIRTEMLLGCSIMRAIDENTCELTQLSHVHSPGVPEMLAKKAAPTQCFSLMRTLQDLFEK